ncbi:MAG TPA: hypothetical protein VI934_02755 [Candidatus Nanoarchaeia archaeon]|nr:hypothetical protein [Candidatus Nanoarchaeia archaeon]
MDGKKRTFRELRSIILIVMMLGQQTTNQISIRTGINWRTVELHLTFLVGKGLVSEIFKSKYVRIFKLTEAGETQANSLHQQNNWLAEGMGIGRTAKKRQEVVTL